MTLLRHRTSRPVESAEAGFTLIELVITIVLLALITGGIATAFVTSISATKGATQRTRESNDAQLIAGFLTKDAQAAGGTNPALGAPDPTLLLGATAGSFTNGCNSPGDPLVGFKWIDRSGAGPVTRAVSYSYVSADTNFQGVAYMAQQLVRSICTNGGASSPSVLANNVVTTVSPKSPLAWCDGHDLDVNRCPDAFPDTVSIRITERNTPVSANTPFTYTLTASLRPQSDSHPEAGNENNTAPMLLLGDSTNCASGAPAIISGNGGADLYVYGAGALDGCPADLGGSSSAEASDGMQVYVPAWSSTKSYVVGNFVWYNGKAYRATQPSLNRPPATNLSSWTLTNPQPCQEVTGTCSVVTTAFADPFAAMIAAGTLTPPSTAGCDGSANIGGAVAGHYQPGPGGIKTFPSVVNANNVTFDAGTYVFCNGLSISGNVIGDNVTFYIAGGQLNVGNNAHFTVSKPTSGPYASTALTVWQAPGNTNDPTSANSANIVVNIYGTMYVPSARVSFKNGAVHIDQVIALGVDLPGGGGITTVGQVPVITTTSPNTRGQGAISQDITINGANFVPGVGILSSDFGAGITVNSTTYVDATHLTANISVAGNAAIGPRDLTVTNGNGRIGTVGSVFNVSAGPHVTSASPNKMGRGLNNQSITITGSGFVNGAIASFGPDIHVDSTTVNTAAQITAVVDVDFNDTIGPRDVTITNPDAGSETLSGGFTVSAPWITNVQLLNKGGAGTTAGKIEAGDKIVITFSSLMKQASVCSGWAPDTSPHNLSATSNLVTVNDVAGSDTINVTSGAGGCTFNFGQIVLGSTGYVTAGNVTFGTGATKTAFNWDEPAHTLTITLGAQTGGGTATVASSSLTYNASGLITDSGSAALAPPAFGPTATAQQF